MDSANIQALAEQAIVLLTPFVLQLRDATAGALADAGVAQMKHLYEKIRDRFKKEEKQDVGKAIKVLENFETDPEEYQVNLRNKLSTILQADPDFLREVELILNSGPAQRILVSEDSMAINNKLRNSAGKGLQSIEVTDGSRADGNTLEIE